MAAAAILVAVDPEVVAVLVAEDPEAVAAVAEAVVAVDEAVAGGAGKHPSVGADRRSTDMNSAATKRKLFTLHWIASAVIWASLSAFVLFVTPMSAAKEVSSAAANATSGAKPFDTPQQAAEALIKTVDKYQVSDLVAIFGPGSGDIILTGESPQDRKRAAEFSAKVREKHSVSVDPKTGRRAILLIGNENWPFPIPIVKRGNKWFFDLEAGRQELLNRRIGDNELDAIAICHRFVAAQHEYALKPRRGYEVNQYAQRIISTSGKQDGLAWQNSDGTWGGPLGEGAARAIAQGYSRGDPFHGYYFKVLKGQGPAAPLGKLNYVVKGVMIGGFALLAAPAQYRVTGVKTFMVSNDGVVYEKDLGPQTLEKFKKLELFNPDQSWTPVQNVEE